MLEDGSLANTGYSVPTDLIDSLQHSGADYAKSYEAQQRALDHEFDVLTHAHASSMTTVAKPACAASIAVKVTQTSYARPQT